MWLDFAEDQATRRKEVFLKDWAEKLDAFLSFNERQVLVGAGKVSHKQAVAHAQSEYEQFAAQRRAALEAEGAAYAVRMLSAGSTDNSTPSTAPRGPFFMPATRRPRVGFCKSTQPLDTSCTSAKRKPS